MVARRHHFLSQCYLKGFVRDRGKPKLFVIDFDRRRSFETSPVNVAVERDFNRYDTGVHAPDAVEAAFSQFEGELAASLDRVCSKQSIKDESDFGFLLNMMALFAVRNPRLRTTMAEFRERTVRVMMNVLVSRWEIWESNIRKAKAAGYVKPDADVDFEEAKSFLKRGAFSIETPTEDHIDTELSTHDAVLQLLGRRTWTLVKAAESSNGFITSDHPVCLFWDLPDTREPRHFGHGTKGTAVLFTISNRFALLGTFYDGAESIEVDQEGVAWVNSKVISLCERQIFAAGADFQYLSSDGALMEGRELADEIRS